MEGWALLKGMGIGLAIAYFLPSFFNSILKYKTLAWRKLGKDLSDLGL